MHADFSVELGREDAALELPWSSADGAVRYYDLKNQPELLQQIPEAVARPELGAFLARINAAGFPLATAKCDAWRSREVAKEEEIYGDRKFVSYIDLVFEDEAARGSFEKHEAFAKTLCRLLSQTPEIPAAVELVILRCYYHGVVGERKVAASAPEAAETAQASYAAGAKEDDERQNGAAKREGADRENADREDADKRTQQQAGVSNGMKYPGKADAGEQTEVDLEKAKAAEPLDQTAADEEAEQSGLDGSVSGFCFTAYITGFGDGDHEPQLRWQIALALLQNALVQVGQRLMREDELPGVAE